MTKDLPGAPLLRIDGDLREESALPHIWSECVGAGRANEALRADWQQQFVEAVDACGFRFIRFHGVFHDDMFVYRESYGHGFGPNSPLAAPVYTFSLCRQGVRRHPGVRRPSFRRAGFHAPRVGDGDETVFWWGAHCSPPKDIARWVELVTRSVEHWIDRYGLAEVREWRFEVWNEPNLVPHFWTGTKTEYFELYEQTVLAIKRIDPELKVGGPVHERLRARRPLPGRSRGPLGAARDGQRLGRGRARLAAGVDRGLHRLVREARTPDRLHLHPPVPDRFRVRRRR